MEGEWREGVGMATRGTHSGVWRRRWTGRAWREKGRREGEERGGVCAEKRAEEERRNRVQPRRKGEDGRRRAEWVRLASREEAIEGEQHRAVLYETGIASECV